MTRKATIGSISHGTLRTQDLLDAFADELERVDEENEFAEKIAEARAVLTLDHAGWSDLVDSEEASELISEMVDSLNEYAPPYCFFGSHPGDGSDFGFWPCMEDIEELPRVSDPSEVDDHAGEDCVFVNDHGNVTVYAADGSVIIDFV